MSQVGLRYGETTLREDLFGAEFAEVVVSHLHSQNFIGQVSERRWADQATVERYVAGIRTWARTPDALWITGVLQTVGWRD